MYKQAILGTETYANTIEKYPLVEAGTLGTIGATGGYMGGGWLADKMVNAILAGKSPEERLEAMRLLEEDGTIENIRKLTAGLGAAAGIGYVAKKQLDFGGGLGASALSNAHYNDPAVQARLAALKEQRLGMLSRQYPGYGRIYSSGRSQKTASFNDAVLDAGISPDKNIPVKRAVGVIQTDPFLSAPQKTVSSMIFEGTDQGTSGLTSERGVMQSALNLGVGAGAGFMLGRAAGAIFSMSPSTIRDLSTNGAIAGALINTGIFSELMR